MKKSMYWLNAIWTIIKIFLIRAYFILHVSVREQPRNWNTLKHLSLRNFMQGISYIIDQGPENSNCMWWISFRECQWKETKKFLGLRKQCYLRPEKKGHWQKIQFTTGYVPNRETEGRAETERKGERKNEKSKLFHSLSSPPVLADAPLYLPQYLTDLRGLTICL